MMPLRSVKVRLLVTCNSSLKIHGLTLSLTSCDLQEELSGSNTLLSILGLLNHTGRNLNLELVYFSKNYYRNIKIRKSAEKIQATIHTITVKQLFILNSACYQILSSAEIKRN